VIRRVDSVTANAFIEPQYTVYKDDEQVPHRQLFAGLNLQF
jgi:hypothetical protein